MEESIPIFSFSFDQIITESDPTVFASKYKPPSLENNYVPTEISSSHKVYDSEPFTKTESSIVTKDNSDTAALEATIVSYYLEQNAAGNNNSAVENVKPIDFSKKHVIYGKVYEDPTLTNQDVYECDICLKQFGKSLQYYGHLRTHAKDVVWSCEKCPQLRFGLKVEMKHHMMQHRKDYRAFNCKECPMAFTCVKALRSHVRFVHNKVRPHKCIHCEQTFTKLVHLKSHQQTHNAPEVYELLKSNECEICHKKFAGTSNLKRHMLIHSKEKPYVCSICGKRYQQLIGLKRHQEISAAAVYGSCRMKSSKSILHHCKICGEKFQYKSSLVEHTVRVHAESISDAKTAQTSHLGRNVDALIEMLLNETDQQTFDVTDKRIFVKNAEESTTESNENPNIPTVVGENATDHLFDIELINEIDEIQNLADHSNVTVVENNDTAEEFQMHTDFFNAHMETINFDSYHANQSFNLQINDLNFESIPPTKDINLFNISSTVEKKSLIEISPDDLLKSVKDPTLDNVKGNYEIDQRISVDDCSTIFESVVDLETSTNFAANLNQLIGENNVQFISTEDDDTYIISLNSAMDAEQLTDLLNIGIEIIDPNQQKESSEEITNDTNNVNDIEIQEMHNFTSHESAMQNIGNIKARAKNKTAFSCTYCHKKFNRKRNYHSHIATHVPKLSLYKCHVCKKKFPYRSTMNKHMNKFHRPLVKTRHQCDLCTKEYTNTCDLRYHKQRDHLKLKCYKCTINKCGKTFYKRFDFIYHQRLHWNVRPYACTKCHRTFSHPSHLSRHRKRVDCLKREMLSHKMRVPVKVTTDTCSSEMSKELLSDIDDLLKSKII